MDMLIGILNALVTLAPLTINYKAYICFFFFSLLYFHIEKNKGNRGKKGWEITKNRVSWVSGDLILSRVTDQAFFVSEGNIRRRRPVALIVDYDFYSIMLPHCHARVHHP
jgi:hypothetical protein